MKFGKDLVAQLLLRAEAPRPSSSRLYRLNHSPKIDEREGVRASDKCSSLKENTPAFSPEIGSVGSGVTNSARSVARRSYRSSSRRCWLEQPARPLALIRGSAASGARRPRREAQDIRASEVLTF